MSEKSVDYYNKEQQIITKKNKEQQSLLIGGVETPHRLAAPSGQPTIEPLEVALGIASKKSPLTNDDVERAIFTFFDNGPSARQRYKLEVRINLVDKNIPSPQFIAPLNKDPKVFRRYTPPGTRPHLNGFYNDIKFTLKNRGIDVKPYFGKFHLKQGSYTAHKKQIQIEPRSYATVWYDEQGWQAVISIYDFILEFGLFEDNLTARQRQANVKGSYLWQNPRYQKGIRPLTWAEQIALNRR